MQDKPMRIIVTYGCDVTRKRSAILKGRNDGRVSELRGGRRVMVMYLVDTGCSLFEGGCHRYGQHSGPSLVQLRVEPLHIQQNYSLQFADTRQKERSITRTRRELVPRKPLRRERFREKNKLGEASSFICTWNLAHNL